MYMSTTIISVHFKFRHFRCNLNIRSFSGLSKNIDNIDFPDRSIIAKVLHRQLHSFSVFASKADAETGKSRYKKGRCKKYGYGFS